MDKRKNRYDDYFSCGYYNPIRYLNWREQPRNIGKRRAGFTTNKRQGTPKRIKKIAQASRKINRRNK